MKKLLIVPIVAVAVAALAPAAHADHGGVQSPDYYEREDQCQVEFVGHAVCTVTNPTPGTVNFQLTYVKAVPTADGWHVAFETTVVDNDSETIMSRQAIDRTIPYVEDWLGIGTPLPSPPFEGLWGGSGGAPATTSASCIVDVQAGTHGTLDCRLPWVVGDDPLPV